MTRVEQLEQKIKRLEQKICCNKTQFYDTLPEFPPVGVENTLYVDNSTGAIYIWDTDTQTYITTDTAPAQRPWIKTSNTSETSATNVLSTDNVFHEGKVTIGANELQKPFNTYYDLQVDGNSFIDGMERADHFYMNKSTLTIAIDPVNGDDTLDPSLYPHPDTFSNIPFSAFFKTWAALVDFVNSVPQTDVAIITLNATISTPIQVDYPLGGFIGTSNRYGNDKTIIGKRVWLFNRHKINNSWLPYYPSTFLVDGAYYDVRKQLSFNNCEVTILRGTFNFYNVVSFQVGQLSVLNFVNCSVLAENTTLNLSPVQSNGSGTILLRNDSSFMFFGGDTINFTANNQTLFRTFNGSNNVLLRNAASLIWNVGAFTGSRFHKKIQGYNNDFGDLCVSFNKNSINTAIDFTECVINLEGRLFLGVDYWQASNFSSSAISYSIDSMPNLFLGGNIPFRVPRISEYADDAAAGAAGLITGMVYKTSAINTLNLPAGVLMVKA